MGLGKKFGGEKGPAVCKSRSLSVRGGKTEGGKKEFKEKSGTDLSLPSCIPKKQIVTQRKRNL